MIRQFGFPTRGLSSKKLQLANDKRNNLEYPNISLESNSEWSAGFRRFFTTIRPNRIYLMSSDYYYHLLSCPNFVAFHSKMALASQPDHSTRKIPFTSNTSNHYHLCLIQKCTIMINVLIIIMIPFLYVPIDRCVCVSVCVQCVAPIASGKFILVILNYRLHTIIIIFIIGIQRSHVDTLFGHGANSKVNRIIILLFCFEYPEVMR